MLTKTERYYENKLKKYFDKYYKAYEETTEFYTNPTINKWKFDIPELGLTVLLTCNDLGQVVEKRERKGE